MKAIWLGSDLRSGSAGFIRTSSIEDLNPLIPKTEAHNCWVKPAAVYSSSYLKETRLCLSSVQFRCQWTMGRQKLRQNDSWRVNRDYYCVCVCGKKNTDEKLLSVGGSAAVVQMPGGGDESGIHNSCVKAFIQYHIDDCVETKWSLNRNYNKMIWIV